MKYFPVACISELQITFPESQATLNVVVKAHRICGLRCVAPHRTAAARHSRASPPRRTAAPHRRRAVQPRRTAAAPHRRAAQPRRAVVAAALCEQNLFIVAWE